MNGLNYVGLLIADQGRFRYMGDRFRDGGSPWEAQHVLIVLLVIGAAIFVAWLLNLYVQSRAEGARRSPKRLFEELCTAHGIDRDGRTLLRILAARLRLRQPGMLFLQPAMFEPGRIPSELRGRKEELSSLAAKLFAEQSPPENTALSGQNETVGCEEGNDGISSS